MITHYTTISYSAAVCTVERKPQETINIDIGSAEWLHYRGVATLHTTVNYSSHHYSGCTWIYSLQPTADTTTHWNMSIN